MQTAGGGFAGTVTSSDQIVDYKVTITFPGSVQTSYQDVTKSTVSVDIQRSITSNLPDGTSLISGYPTAVATVVLSGFLNQNPGVALVESQSIFWLMNPNDPTSPMYLSTRGGLPIVIQAGLWDGASSADLVTIFTGTIDQCACSDGTVTLTCRDQRSTITNQAYLPPVITEAPYNAGLTSEFAIDYLLRHSSPAQYYSWPAQRSNCLLAVGLRSSLWPEIGSYASYPQAPVFDQGVYGTELAGGNEAQAVYTLAAPIATTDHFCGQFIGSDSGVGVTGAVVLFTAAADYGITVERLGTILAVLVHTPSGDAGGAVTTASGDALIEWSISWPAGSTSVTGTIWVNGTSTPISITAAAVRAGASFTLVGVAGGMEGLQVTNETSFTPLGSFSPTLIFDPAGSLNSLVALPDVGGQDTWSVLQDIAAAESAVIGFDELGLCHFTNRETIHSVTSDRTITSTASLANLDSLEQMSLCATHIQVPVNQIQIAPFAIVWQASTVITVQPGIPVVVNAALTNPALSVPTQDSGFLTDTTTWSYQNAYWMACTTPDGLGIPITTGISFTVWQTSASALTIVITNVNAVTAYLVAPSGHPTAVGTPVLIIGGQPIVSVANTVANNSILTTGTGGQVIVDLQWPPQIPATVAGAAPTGGAASNATFGDILLSVPASGWMQSTGSADLLASDLLSDLHYPIPLLRNIDIVADPRLQLLDTATIVDTDVSMINDLSILVGIETKFSANDWSQSIDARPLWPPGAWELGIAGHSELGTTTYLY